MDDFINMIVFGVCMFVAGMAFHSTGSHEGYFLRARLWIERLFGRGARARAAA